MRASRLEFEYRFWIFGLIFFLGFSLYRVDPVNAGMGLLGWLAPGTNANSANGNVWMRAIFLGGAALTFTAALLRTWATAWLQTEVVHDMAQHAEQMVADGPFRYTRNPLYLANLFLAAGMGMMMSRLGWIFVLIASAVFDQRLILREEAGLREAQGPNYEAYLKSVPRLIPSLRPRVPASGGRAHWVQAIAGESFVWIFGLAELSFAITLAMNTAWIFMALSFLVYFAAVLAVKRRAARRARTSAEV